MAENKILDNYIKTLVDWVDKEDLFIDRLTKY